MTLLDTDNLNKNKNNKGQKLSFWGYVFDFVKLIVFAVIFVWLVHHFIFQPFVVFGPSMEPNYFDQDYLIIEKVTKLFGDIKRGDVVVFRSPQNKEDFLIKRVVALPNERIKISRGEIYIFNDEHPKGFKLDETEYLPSGLKTGGEVDYHLHQGEYFVLGDNRNLSLDSRVFGVVRKDEIVGKPVFKGLPLKAFGALNKRNLFQQIF